MRKVGSQGILRDSHVEAVRKPDAAEAMQCFQAIRPILAERLAAAPINLEARATRVSRANFESGGEDDAVHLVLDSVEHQALLRDAIDTAAHGVHESDVGTVERGQILVVEGRAFAELAVPRL